MCNDMFSKVWDEIPYPFTKFSDTIDNILELKSNLNPHVLIDVITSFAGLKLIHVIKTGSNQSRETECLQNKQCLVDIFNK